MSRAFSNCHKNQWTVENDKSGRFKSVPSRKYTSAIIAVQLIIEAFELMVIVVAGLFIVFISGKEIIAFSVVHSHVASKLTCKWVFSCSCGDFIGRLINYNCFADSFLTLLFLTHPKQSVLSVRATRMKQ